MIEQYLKKHHMSQKQFSELTGIPQSTISYIKLGKIKKGKTVDKIKKIIEREKKEENSCYIKTLFNKFIQWFLK